MPQHDRLPVRRSRFDDPPTRRHRNRFDDEVDDAGPARRRPADPTPSDDAPPTGDRWSTWDIAQHGPTPHPDWLVTELAAVDTQLGMLKTGKEADVHLVLRAVPGTARSCQLAAKRYRSAGCSTATPAISRAGEYAAPGRRGRWRGAPPSAGVPVSGIKGYSP